MPRLQLIRRRGGGGVAAASGAAAAAAAAAAAQLRSCDALVYDHLPILSLSMQAAHPYEQYQVAHAHWCAGRLPACVRSLLCCGVTALLVLAT